MVFFFKLSSIYNKIHEKTREITKFQLYYLIKEYDNYSVLPPPFSLIELLIIKPINLIKMKLFNEDKNTPTDNTNSLDKIISTLVTGYEKNYAYQYWQQQQSDKIKN